MDEKTDVNITFRVPAELRQAMEEAAAAEQRPLSNWLRVVIARALKVAPAERGDFNDLP